MTKKPNPTATYTMEELQAMLHKMRRASSVFYANAANAGCHAFIEFTGLMNEYIKICEDALAEGKDFTQFNIHSGQPLIKEHQRLYMQEKIECIFGVPLEISVKSNTPVSSQ